MRLIKTRLDKEDVVLVDVCTTENREVEGNVESYEKVNNYNVVCLKFEHGYVPVKHINGFRSYIKTMTSEEYNNRFLSCLDDKYICSVPNGGGYFVKNVRQVFNKKGYVDMEFLKTIDTLCQGFPYTIFQDELKSIEPEVEREIM